MKICTKCKVEQPLHEFYFKSGYKDNIDSCCKSCHKKTTNQWRLDNPESVKRSRIKHKFGLSMERYEQMFQEQNGVCAICSLPETMIRLGKKVPLSVDHDRSCCPTDRSCGNCIRGLLCYACNTGIGRFKDDPMLLEQAIRYLNNHPMKGDK